MTENESIKELEASIDLAKMCTQNYERKREIQGYEMAINALKRDVCTYNIALRYGMVQENREPIKFYFEKVGEADAN